MSNIDYKEKLKLLNLIEKDNYNRFFDKKIINMYNPFLKEKNIKEFESIMNNKYKAKYVGVNEYYVEVELDNNLELLDFKCDCPYHKEVNQYCKHIYALLQKVILVKNNIKIQNKINEDLNLFKKELDSISEIIEKNKNKVNDAFVGMYINGVFDRHSENYKRYCGFSVLEMRERDSIILFNTIISALDEIRNDKAEILESLENYYKEKEVESDTISATYTFDETTLFNGIDNQLLNLDLNVLLETRERMLLDGDDTEIIDKIINQKKQIQKNKKQNVHEKLSIDKETKEYVEYEDYNYEEEELEEDDYHYDDLD